MIHVLAKHHVHPSKPVVRGSRAVIAFHVGNRHYPDGDNDRIRALENERVPWTVVEDRFPRFNPGDQPLLVDEKIAREIFINSWMKNDKEIDARDPAVHVAACSVRHDSKKGEGVALDRIEKFSRNQDCENPFQSCRNSRFEKGRILMNSTRVTRVPTCITLRGDKAKALLSRGNRIRVIENVDALKNLVVLNLSENQITKIEGLDTLTKLRWINLSRNQIEKIENLDKNVDLEQLWLERNQIEKIENLDTFTKLEKLDLQFNYISEIDDLDKNVRLHALYLDGNFSLPDDACIDFNAERERNGLNRVECFR